MVGRIFSHSLVYAVGPQLPKIVGLFLLPILTPHLSTVDFGIWGTVTAYSLIFTSCRDLGMVVPLFNSYYKHPGRWIWVWRQIIWYLLLWGILLTFIQSILLYVVFPTEAMSNRLEVLSLLAIQCLFFDVPILMGSRLLQASESPIKISIISICSGFAALSAQYYFIVVRQVGYMGWFYATFISLAITACAYCVLLYRKGLVPLPVFRKRWAASRFRVALPLLPHNYSSYLLNASDRVMLSAYRIPVGNIGLYNVAYMWGNYMEVLGNAVGMAVGPLYLKSYRSEGSRAFAKQITIFLQVIFIVGSFIIALWSKEFFVFFLRNESLSSAYAIAIIIIMSYTYRPLYWGAVNKLQYDEKTSKLWKISFIAGVLNIGLNTIFIPLFGYKAAVFTTFAAMLYQGFAGYFFKEDFGFKVSELICWFLAIVGSTIVVYICKDLNVLLKCLLTIAILTIFMAWLLRFSKLLNLRNG